MYYEDNCIISVGLKEARRCSYLGELDSNEEESDEISEEFEFEHNTQADTHTMYDTTSVQNSQKQYPYFPNNLLRTKPSTNNLTLGNFTNKNEDVTDFVDAFNGLNQHSRNIIVNKLLESLGQSNKNINTKYDAERYLKFSAHQAPTKMEIAKIKKQDATNKDGKQKKTRYNAKYTNKNINFNFNQNTFFQENQNERVDGGEVFDDEIVDEEQDNKNNVGSPKETQSDIYDLMQKGNFNQKNKKDGSREKNPEPFSSWSSSEEALMKCEGLLTFQQLNGNKSCKANASDTESEITYVETISETGFYYFIFANENEITDNFMRVRFDLHKTIFDVSSAKQNCTNTTQCLLSLSFWSKDHVVLEIPEIQPQYQTSNANNMGSNKTSPALDPCHEDNLIKGYSSVTECHQLIVAQSVCTPRKPIYMVFVLLVPILILCFSYI